MKIYTKVGDDGSTSLFGGERVSKSNDRVEAYGSLDELNSFVGVLMEFVQDESILSDLEIIQNKLFNIGSHLATIDEKYEQYLPALNEDMVNMLEERIDLMSDMLPVMKEFILPGGSKAVAFCHVARTQCRKVERNVVRLSDQDRKLERIIIYLNRLSDYFFVLARFLLHKDGIKEKNWNKNI